MNTNPNNTPLTREQLEDMARRVGFSDIELENHHSANEKPAMWRSWLEHATRELRFQMMCEGELIFRTKQHVPGKPKEIKVDPWFLAQKERAA